MNSKPILMRPRRRRLVNAAMDAYLDWRDECAAVSGAYRCWADAGAADAAPAWRTYEAALDREEHASARYAALVQHVADLAAPDPEPGTELATLVEALR
jgi:hypothetical protein